MEGYVLHTLHILNLPRWM